MKTTLTIILTAMVLSFISMALFINLISWSIEGEEIRHCLNFQYKSEKYPNHYIAEPWDRICEKHGIQINSTVKWTN